ncbi:unnamed protein product [Heterobilharzia americana]|nr:unnamed protein product [Heterobilharzia americana]
MFDTKWKSHTRSTNTTKTTGNGRLLMNSRSVYLATDEPMVFKQFTTDHPNYTLYGSQSRSQSPSVKNRMSIASMDGALADVIALSQTDFLVCTFSSNVSSHLTIYSLSHKIISNDSEFANLIRKPTGEMQQQSHDIQDTSASFELSVHFTLLIEK